MDRLNTERLPIHKRSAKNISSHTDIHLASRKPDYDEDENLYGSEEKSPSDIYFMANLSYNRPLEDRISEESEEVGHEEVSTIHRIQSVAPPKNLLSVHQVSQNPSDNSPDQGREVRKDSSMGGR